MNPINPGAIPDQGINNVWYKSSGADTVFIFVHGIFSDSQGCWLYRRPSKEGTDSSPREVYWPRLIAQDPRFAGADIFLAGFHTAPDANSYGLQDSAHVVYQRLSIPYEPAKTPVIGRKNLIFIGHSTGGIVIRYLLTRNQIELRDKNIGVVLMASPSTGSVYADRLRPLTRAYRSELGRLLETDNLLSKDLDDRFSEMVRDKPKYIPRLVGAEACEHQIIFRKGLLGRAQHWFPPLVRSLIVDPASAGRYFRPAERIPGTDHFSIVKPASIQHASHDFLYRFWYRFGEQISPAVQDSAAIPALGPPRPTENLFGRTALLSAAKQALLNGSHCVALHGPTGAGKSFVASAISNDPEIRAKFPGGVLWASLAEAERDASAVLALWADALGIPRSSISELRLVEDRARAVANAVGDRKMIVVCEDCETAETAVLMRLIGTGGARLLTTTAPEVAASFAGPSASFRLDPLTDIDALQLLASVSNIAAESEDASWILRATGKMPGDILLVARMIAGAKSPEMRRQLIKVFHKEAA
ncbi:MAG TPA: NB-ARC domain-containing protein [Acidisarcina sp.]